MSATNTQQKTSTQAVNEIKTEALVAGDVIATRAHSVNSRGVRFFTGGQVSHAILYTGGKAGLHWVVDAMPKDGVTLNRLHNKLRLVSYAVAFRHRTATDEQRARACQWAELQAKLNKPYDYNSAARVGRPKHTRVGRLIVLSDDVSAWLDPEGEDASFMCSELVFRAFEIAGTPLIDKPAHSLSPNMLLKTERLACLGRLV